MTLCRACVSFGLEWEFFMKKFTTPEANEIWAVLEKAGEKLDRISEEVGDLKLLSAKTGEHIKQVSVETSEKIAEHSAETSEKIAELSFEVKKTNKGLREARDLFTSQWGRLIESFVKGGLVDLLKEKNIDVISTESNMEGTYKGKNWELDIVAINGSELVIVEVKTNLKVKDIDHFSKKLEFFTKWRPIYKGKKIYGAVAYIRTDEHSTKYAEKQGLFVIRATGNNAKIINQKNFKPKTYS